MIIMCFEATGLHARVSHWLFCWSARSLPGGYRFDNDAVSPGRIEWDFSPAQRLVDKLLNHRLVELRSVRQDNVFCYISLTFEKASGIGKALCLQEEEADPSGIHRDGNDGVGGAFGWAEADGESVVVVVNEFERMRKPGPHPNENFFGATGNLWCESREEFG